MIVVQHKSTLEVKYLSVEEWMEPGAYQHRRWKLLDIEDTVRLCYKGKSVGIYDRQQAQRFSAIDTDYTCTKLTLSDCFILVNKNFYQNWQKITGLFSTRQQINFL